MARSALYAAAPNTAAPSRQMLRAANVRSAPQARLDIAIARLRDRAVRHSAWGYRTVPVPLADLSLVLKAATQARRNIVGE